MKKIPSLKYEKALIEKGFLCIAGVDEAGRGAWAGPIVAAAAVIKIKNPLGFARGRQKSKIKNFALPRLYNIRDSKMLSAKDREELYKKIIDFFDDWTVGIVEVEEINELGLAMAGKLVLERAVKNLKSKPEYLLIDAFKIPTLDIPQINIIKGDQKCFSIACASIIAKVTRDRIMKNLDSVYPKYGFAEHKGYGTKKHLEAIEKYGLTPIHRKNFQPVAQTKMFF